MDVISGEADEVDKQEHQGEYDALILAAAGLRRLGLESRISRYFSPEEMLPAAGQGVLAIQGREKTDHSFLKGFGAFEAAMTAKAERAFVRCLDGGCSSPVAAYAEVTGDTLRLRGLYYREKDYFFTVGSKSGLVDEAEQIGVSLAQELKNRYDVC